MARNVVCVRLVRLITLYVCASAAHQLAICAWGESSTPVVVELFTSEGCSSCPPADGLVQQLDASQPIPHTQLIVLSEHVDYWNRDGWKDPFSSHLLTERQRDYVHSLHLSEPYTPQMIVDGSTEIQGNDPAQFAQILQKAGSVPKVTVRIASVGVDSSNPPRLHARIEVEVSPGQPRDGEVYVAVALNHAESQVLKGENSGRHLTHVAAVEDLVKIGKLEGGKSFAQDFQQKLKPGTAPSNMRVIAFVQETGLGRVLGAALQKAPFR